MRSTKFPRHRQDLLHPFSPRPTKEPALIIFKGGYGAKYVKAVLLTFECLLLLLLKATRAVSASPPWIWPSTWSPHWLQMATSSALSCEQQRARRVTEWPLNPINALPPLIGRQYNLTAWFWLLTMLLGEAVFLYPRSCLPLSLGLGPAYYFLPRGTGAGCLEKQWSLPLWRGSFEDSLHKPLHMMDFGDWQLDMG